MYDPLPIYLGIATISRDMMYTSPFCIKLPNIVLLFRHLFYLHTKRIEIQRPQGLEIQNVTPKSYVSVSLVLLLLLLRTFFLLLMTLYHSSFHNKQDWVHGGVSRTSYCNSIRDGLSLTIKMHSGLQSWTMVISLLFSLSFHPPSH